MERAAAQRRYEALHDEKSGQWHDGTFKSWGKERSIQYPYHRDDGVNIWVSPVDLSPDDRFLSTESGDDEPGPSEDGED